LFMVHCSWLKSIVPRPPSWLYTNMVVTFNFFAITTDIMLKG